MRPHRRRGSLTRRRVRWRVLLATIAISGGLVAAVVAAHEYQSPRAARLLAKNADLSEREGKFGDAVATLRLYTAMNPNDVEMEEKLAILLTKFGNPRADFEANNRLRQLLRRDPHRPQARSALLTLSLRNGDLAEAKRQAIELENSKDADVPWLSIAQVFQATTDVARAGAAYDKAIAQSPKSLEVYQRYADLLINSLNEPQKAERLLTAMLEKNPANPLADLIDYVVRRDHKLPNADVALDAALEHGPTNIEVLLMAAGRESNRDPATAKALLKRAREIRPSDIRVPLVLGKLLQSQRDYAGALTQFEDGFEKSGRTDPELAWRTAELLIELKRSKTLPKYLAALILDPRFRPVHAFLRARMDAIDGRDQQAKDGFQAARTALESPLLQGAPADYRQEISFKAELGYAGAAFQLGLLEESAQAARKARDLSPNDPLPYLTLATIDQQNHQFVEAADELRSALSKPGCPPQAQFQLAQVLLFDQLATPPDERNYKEFIAALDGVERTLPNLPELPQLKADYAIAIKQIERALATLKAGVQAYPNNQAVALSLIRALAFAGKSDEALQQAAKVEAKFGRSIASALSIAQIHLDRNKPAEAVAVLRAVAEKATDDRKQQLKLPFAQTVWMAGDNKTASAAYRELSGMADADSYHSTSAIDFALEATGVAEAFKLTDFTPKPPAEVQAWASAWLAAQDSKIAPATLALTARSHFQTAQRLRPYWWGTRELEALAADLEGDRQKAVRLYRRALLAGPGYAFVADRLLQLQIESRRLEDAADILAQLRRQRLPRPADVRLQIDLQAAQGKSAEAIKLAETVAAGYAGNTTWSNWLARLKAR